MSNYKSIEAWQNDTISLVTEAPDDTATSAKLLIGTPGEESVFSKTANFVDNKADLTVLDSENVQGTIPFGEYKYMVEVSYSDGSTLTFPNPDDCSDEELPDFIIKQRIE
jgi:hypothetical protein